MTEAEAAYLEALAAVRAWHRFQISAKFAEPVRIREVHEQAIAWIDEVVKVRRERVAEGQG